MPRGGLSNDPEKRARQLAGLQKGNERAAAKLTELGTPAAPAVDDTGKEEPVQPGRGRVEVGKVEYPKPGKDEGASPAKKKRDRPATTPPEPGKDEPTPPPSAKPKERLPGFWDGLQLPSFRRRD